VGGGINGTGIARDAAGRGLRVILCEQDDLAAHTSSASTKLIHGGLRYLEELHFALVRKALAEREILLAAAPHIMRPACFSTTRSGRVHTWRPRPASTCAPISRGRLLRAATGAASYTPMCRPMTRGWWF
jgi:glycerol-3-phosphate dehydrogenase